MMRGMMRVAAGVMVLMAAGVHGAEPTTAPATVPTTGPGKGALAASDKLAVAAGRVTVGGKALDYTSTSGYMSLKDEAGKVRANVFFVAYTKELGAGEKAAARPVMFVFNGGPGASSVWLHLGAVGPWRVPVVTEKGEGVGLPAPPYKLVENAYTWLGETDLVFIDPVGTGYSRVADPEKAKEFYNTKEDVASIGEFIRLYATKYERWESPKFLAGESYGTTRAALLAEHLQERVGMSVNGVVLVSAVLNFGLLNAGEHNELPYALYLPSYAAVAFYHKRLPPELQKDLDKTLAEVEEFATGAYLAALVKGDRLGAAEQAAVAEKVARYTGLSVGYVMKAGLRIDAARFEKELLSNEGKIVGRFDGRITGLAADAVGTEAEFDPSLTQVLPVYTATFNAYVRETLRYENELPYEVLKGLPFSFGTERGAGYLYVGDNLRAAMQKNPHLKVLVAAGRYDLATPFFGVDYTVSHLGLPAALRGNVTQTYYPGGHMMYHEKGSLEKLQGDVAGFVRGAVGK